jgi:hypothetical protein
MKADQMIPEPGRESGSLLRFQCCGRRRAQRHRHALDVSPAAAEGKRDLASGKATGLPRRATLSPQSSIGGSLHGQQQLPFGAVTGP